MKAYCSLLVILIFSTWATQGALAEQGPNNRLSNTSSAKARGGKPGGSTLAVHTGAPAHGPGSKNPGLTRASAKTGGQRPGAKGSSSINGTGIRVRSSSVNGTTVRSKH